jgi:hypothetical protein
MRNLHDEQQDFQLIDAGGSREEVAESIWAAAMTVFERVDASNGPLMTVEEATDQSDS